MFRDPPPILHPTGVDSPWSLRALGMSYATGWACVVLAWANSDTPTLLVPAACFVAAAALLRVEGGGRRSALALALVGLCCGWLCVAPALGAALHTTTQGAERPGVDPGGVQLGSALATSVGHQLLAALAGTVATPAAFAALSLLGARRNPQAFEGRPSLAAPIHALAAAAIQVPAVFFALVPMMRSLWGLAEKGGDTTLGLAATAAVLAATVGSVVAAWAWARHAWRTRDVKPSFWLTVLGTPLVSLLVWGMPLVVGLMAVQSVGAIVPLRGDAPPVGADPLIMHTLTRVFAGWLLLGPLAMANLWFVVHAAHTLGRRFGRPASA